jgi:hypothetical protein
MGCDRRWRESLSAPMQGAAHERERLFGLGWLNWLEGNWAIAEGILAEADMRCRVPVGGEAGESELPPLDPGVLAGRAAYWLARVRVLLGRPEAIGEYQSAMRRLGGSPQTTAWYVDLLWRAGSVHRAEQVWKSLRGNKRVQACDEAPLAEARSLLRKGELVPAEKLLREANPASGVVWVEGQLLLSWTLASIRQPDKAAETLRLACEGPYPQSALVEWRRLLDARIRGLSDKPAATARQTAAPFLPLQASDVTSPTWSMFVRAQEARAEGKRDEATSLYRSLLDCPALQPFARFGLACLGEEETRPSQTSPGRREGETDPTTVPRTVSGSFFDPRCRVLQAIDRFRGRECGAAELLEDIDRATRAGYQSGATEHFMRLAITLRDRQPETSAITSQLSGEVDGPARRNAARIALELACRLPPGAALPVLLDLRETVAEDRALRDAIGHQVLRVAILCGNTGSLASLEGPLSSAARAIFDTSEVASDVQAHPAVSSWQAALALHAGKVDDNCRKSVGKLRGPAVYRGIAQVLLLYEAAARGDIARVGVLLEQIDVWRAFRERPPRFVLLTLLALVGAHPTFVGWRKSLPAWLRLWDRGTLGPEGTSLAVAVGVTEAGESEDAPPSMVPVEWFLHQASRAIQRRDMIAALAFTRRAISCGSPSTVADVVGAALPVLERRAEAQALARCLDEAESHPGVLADLVELLPQAPGGAAVLQAARGGNSAAAWLQLEELSTQPGLPGRLHHHLALSAWRSATHRERQGDEERASMHWRIAWHHWLAYLGSSEAPAEADRERLLDHLLGVHARHVNDRLASGVPGAARTHWTMVQSLATRSEDLAARVARFRDDLATQYLLTAREAMRHGQIPEGWRANYERGLALSCRLLSLDRENVRLLTALVETCASWFIDLYNTQDWERLREQVKRFTPFGLQLARLMANRPGELTTRSALAEFWKFRGFLETDPSTKAGLYREALRFDPANNNVRDLLAEGEESDPNGSEHE